MRHSDNQRRLRTLPLSSTELDAIYLTIALASITTVILLLLGTPLAWWLSRRRGNVAALIEALVAMPLILPPTVLGFYLLMLFAPTPAWGILAAADRLAAGLQLSARWSSAL